MAVTLDARIWVRGKLNGLAAKLSGRRIGEVQRTKSGLLGFTVPLHPPSNAECIASHGRRPVARVAYAHHVAQVLHHQAGAAALDAN